MQYFFRYLRFAALLLALWASLYVPRAQAGGRVIILGFDGMDPGLLRSMMDAGELPNFVELSKTGTFTPLETSNPPQSPTAWSSFTTCKTPFNHGIYDFLRRDPKTYFPAVGFGSVNAPKFAPDGTLVQAPSFVNNRHGDSFWKLAGQQGKRVKALVVPFAYPAEDLEDGCLQICGLDARDLRGTQSTYFAIDESCAAEEQLAGGMRLPLKFEEDAAVVQVPGIAKPDGAYARVPVSVAAERGAHSVTVSVQGKSATLAEGAWSPWMEWTFAVTPKYDVRAISRFHAMEVGSSVRIYMSCLQYHPEDPLIPISTPGAYAGELADRYGLYKTIGWVYDTKALEQDNMSEAMFLDDVAQTMSWREQLTLDEIDRGNFDMLLAAWTATDRVAHLFWAYRDPEHPLYTPEMAAKYGRAVENTYIKADEIVGKVMAKLEPEDLLMVLSDHGFHSFRYGFSVNTWLVRHGYLVLKGQTDPATAFTDTKFLQGIDWTRTRAYGLGLGMVFLNLQGREKIGIVPQTGAQALLDEIKAGLLAERDSARDLPIFRNVYVNYMPVGAAVADAPDIQLGYAEGYQTDKASAAGAAPAALLSPNTSKWSGEHASSDVAFTPGAFFSNRALKTPVNIMDLGVSALTYLGAQVPSDFEGKSVLP